MYLRQSGSHLRAKVYSDTVVDVKKPLVKISVWVRSDEAEKIRAAAAAEDRTVSKFVGLAAIARAKEST